jgi:hypothetical protein
MRVLLRLPRFGGASYANGYYNRSLEGTARLSAAAKGGDIARAAGELTETAPDATTILSRDDGDLEVERDRLGGRSRAEQQAASIQYDSGLAQGPAEPRAARLMTRQKNAAVAARLLLWSAVAPGEEVACST